MDQSLVIASTMGKAAMKGFTVIGSLYSLYQFFYDVLFPNKTPFIDFSFYPVTVIFLLTFLCYSISDIYKLYNRSFPIATTGRTIAARIGNLLSFRNGTVLVGINDTLTYDVDKIGTQSIQYQLIKKYGETWMRDICENAKAGETPDANGCYPYGYYFTANSPKCLLWRQHFVFIVMSHLEADAVPVSTVDGVRQALKALFHDQYPVRFKNNRLYMPILGTGNTALTSKQDIAELIAFLFASANFRQSTAIHDLIIIFRRHNLKKINIFELNNHIENFAQICYQCPGKIHEDSTNDINR